MGLTERLELSRRSLELVNVLKSADASVSERLKWSRERLEILKKLKVNTSPKEEDFSLVASQGSSLCRSYGYDVPKGLKSELEGIIANDSEMTKRIANLPYSDRKKKEIAKKIKSEPRDYDIYRIAGGLKHRQGYDVYERAHEIQKAYYTSVGTEAMSRVYSGLLEDSPVSSGEALRLAKQSPVDSAAKNRISRQRKGDFKGARGLDSLHLSTSTLYRLIAFQGKPIGFTVRDSRADFAHKSRTISVGTGLQKRTLWHELAHSIEYDHPDVLNMVKSFLKARLDVSNGIRPLNDIYADKWGSKRKIGYDKSELTIDDGAFAPYVTKFYCHDGGDFEVDNATATEVLAMGIECFSDPLALGRMITHDPEHFEFVVGVIKHLHDKSRAGVSNGDS